MNTGYYLHRISHEWSKSKPLLLEYEFLSVGWSKLKDSSIVKVTENHDKEEFEKIYSEIYSGEDISRNRHCLYRFLCFSAGDKIVVPLYNKEFCIVEVENGERARSIRDLPDDIKKSLNIDEHGLDLGFIIKVKILNRIPRSYAAKKLESRMKIRQTNSDISDLVELVEKAITTTNDLDLHQDLRETLSKSILDSIRKLNSTRMERLVKWYMEKRGASNVEILPKNNSEKIEMEDADIRADFDDLNIVIYIQVKSHEGETQEWAVEQIQKYMKYHESHEDTDITYCNWVISTADCYSDTAIEKAQENNIRLIDGLMFSRMILDVGISDINDII